MTSPPTLLYSAHQLPSLFPLSAITVLLLSTSYTHETVHVRQSLQRASAFISCPSVSYYELQVHIADLYSSPPQISALARLWPGHPSSQQYFQAHLAHNITQNIPWFPCLRVFRTDDLDDVYTHSGGFEVESIARAVNRLCGKESGEGVGELASKDQFAKETAEGKNLGVLVRTSGKETKRTMEVMKEAVARMNKGGARQWVMGLDERLDNTDSVLLVDRGKDIISEIGVISMDVETVIMEMKLFERRGYVRRKQWEGGKGKRLGDRVLQYVDGWRGWQGYINEECEVGLRRFMEGDYGWETAEGVTVFVVVCETWCGLCQRIMIWLEKWEGRLKGEREYIVGIWGGTLPEEIDRVVDGVPAVVEVREVGGNLWTSELEGGIVELVNMVGKRQKTEKHQQERLCDAH